MGNSEKKYIVRCWDYYDGWYDITGPKSYEEAQAEWNKHTKNGTEHSSSKDFNTFYYHIFPADTTMLWSSEWMDK